MSDLVLLPTVRIEPPTTFPEFPVDAGTETVGVWGALRLIQIGQGPVVPAQDITVVNGVPTIIESVSWGSPGGCLGLVFRTAGRKPTEPAEGLWYGTQSFIELRKIVGPTDPGVPIWVGFVTDQEDDSEGFTRFECMGMPYRWNNILFRPDPNSLGVPRDIGTLLAELLADEGLYQTIGVQGPAPVTTGIKVVAQGRYEQVWSGAVHDLLGMSTTADGLDQWTVRFDPVTRRMGITRKSVGRNTWTVHCAAPGVRWRLRRDHLDFATVMYGSGTNPDGGRWRNTKYPRSNEFVVPDGYPGTAYTVGTGDPFLLAWEQAVNILFPWVNITADGTYTNDEVAQVYALQAHLGLEVNGVIGPQTYEAVMQPSAAGFDPLGAYVAPLAFKPSVVPYLYNGSGGIVGENPDFAVNDDRRERHIEYGTGVEFADGRAAAEAEFLRDRDTKRSGTVTLTVDPAEGARWDIRPDDLLVLTGWNGMEAPGFHVVAVEWDIENVAVAVTVDEKFRDLANLAQVQQREKAAIGPNRTRPAWGSRASRTTDDRGVTWDAESPAGRIRRTAVSRQLWTVQKVPAARSGRIVRFDLTAEHATRMACGVYDRPITPAELHAVRAFPEAPLGNPLYDGFWTHWADTGGLVMAYGGEGNAWGFWPGMESDTDPVVTGVGRDDASWDFVTVDPTGPYLYVAVWVELPEDTCPAVTFVSGRMRHAPWE